VKRCADKSTCQKFSKGNSGGEAKLRGERRLQVKTRWKNGGRGGFLESEKSKGLQDGTRRRI